MWWPWAPSAPPPAEPPRISRERPVLRGSETATAAPVAATAAPVAVGAASPSAVNGGNATGIQTADSECKAAISHYEAWTGYPNERLSMTLEGRATILVGAAFLTGFCLGGSRGGQQAADRYRAENAHRYPSTEAGWYLYQRSKNYNLFLGACQAGVRSGAVLSLWTAGFMVTEEGIDQLRTRLVKGDDDDSKDHTSRGSQRDFLSTVVAALAVAGVHSRVHHFNTFTTVKTSTMALKAGLAFGLAQDAVACLRGGSDVPAYLRWLWPVGDTTTTTTTNNNNNKKKTDEAQL